MYEQLKQPGQKDTGEQFRFLVAFRKSLTEALQQSFDGFEKRIGDQLSIAIQKKDGMIVKVDNAAELQKAIREGFANIEFTLPKINVAPPNVQSKLSLSDTDVIRLSKVFQRDDLTKGIRTLVETLEKRNAETSDVFWSKAVEYFKKNPQRYLNVRMTNGTKFIEKLTESIVTAVGGGEGGIKEQLATLQSALVTAISGISSGSGVDPVGLKNVAAEQINPATSENQSAGNAFLETIDDTIDLIWQSVDQLEEYLDNVEAPLTTISGLMGQMVPILGTLQGNLDNVEGPLTTISGLVGQMLPLIDEVETKLTTINTTISAPITTISGLLGQIYSLANSWNTSGSVKVAEQGKPTVKPNYLVKAATPSASSVDDAAVLVFDASADSTVTAIQITNAGDEDIYLFWANTAGPLIFFKKLAAGEDTGILPIGYTSDDTNDIYAERASAQTNDDVYVSTFKENA